MAPIVYEYHPIPTSDESLPEVDRVNDSSPRVDFKSVGQAKTKLKRRKAFIFIFLFAIFFTMVFTLRKLFLSSKGVLKGCREFNRNMSSVKLPSHYTLPSGDKIPAIGLGVWRSAPSEVGNAVKVALKAGYRHIDGAWIYGNEREVGEAIKQSSTPRENIWITSKLWNTFHNPEDIEPALDDTLQRLGTDYVDLYLIHWPVAFKNDQREVDFDLTENPYPTWKKMEEMVKKGKARNIGVSNFNIRRLQNLTANALEIQPALNQVELSYWNPQPELLKWSKEKGMLLEAYSPLGSAERVKESLRIPAVRAIAKELGMTPAQVYISWHIQRGTIVLPKSVTPSRIEENIRVSSLPVDAFECLERAATSHEPLRSVDPSKNWGVDIWN